MTTLHPDEQAREWLIRQDSRFHSESYMPGTVAELSALLARVRQQALEEAAQLCEADNTGAFMEANIRRAFADSIRSLRQAAGEETK